MSFECRTESRTSLNGLYRSIDSKPPIGDLPGIGTLIVKTEKTASKMKIYNLVVFTKDWLSSTIYANLEDAVKEVDSMVEGQKYLESPNEVDVHKIEDYEGLTTPFYMNYGERKYAVETRSIFRGEITTMWRIVYEQEVK